MLADALISLNLAKLIGFSSANIKFASSEIEDIIEQWGDVDPKLLAQLTSLKNKLKTREIIIGRAFDKSTKEMLTSEDFEL